MRMIQGVLGQSIIDVSGVSIDRLPIVKGGLIVVSDGCNKLFTGCHFSRVGCLRERIRYMAKKEVKTDLWVYAQLNENHINADAQGSDVKEIDEALKTASKRGTGNAGYPEYVAVIDDFVLVVEDKADVAQQIKLTDDGVVATDVNAVTEYAVNGAYFYGSTSLRTAHSKRCLPSAYQATRSITRLLRCTLMTARAIRSWMTSSHSPGSLPRISMSTTRATCLRKRPM